MRMCANRCDGDYQQQRVNSVVVIAFPLSCCPSWHSHYIVVVRQVRMGEKKRMHQQQCDNNNTSSVMLLASVSHGYGSAHRYRYDKGWVQADNTYLCPHSDPCR